MSPYIVLRDTPNQTKPKHAEKHQNQPRTTQNSGVSCVGADGLPLADAAVTVTQANHDFLFGNIGFDLVDVINGSDTSEFSAQLMDDYLALFNATTLPFYLGRFEKVRAEPDTARQLAAARFFQAHGQVVKGHPLLWHSVTPAWLNTLALPEVEAVYRARIRRDVADFAGVIDTWDAINEAVIMPVFTADDNAVTKLAYLKGRIAMVRLAFEEARATNPAATLLINDFDLGSAYECLIEGCLEAGIPIDVIGLQTHMHQGFRGEEYLIDKVEKFARYGLPLHFTETSLVSGHLMPPEIVDLNDYHIPAWPSTPEGEERQAEEIRRHYTCLVSQPAVRDIVYWGITDRRSWLGAPIGLIRADGTHKPSYDMLAGLIKGEWWVSTSEGRTDSNGQFELDGWLGSYDVSFAGQTRRIHLGTPGCLSLEVRL